MEGITIEQLQNAIKLIRTSSEIICPYCKKSTMMLYHLEHGYFCECKLKEILKGE